VQQLHADREASERSCDDKEGERRQRGRRVKRVEAPRERATMLVIAFRAPCSVRRHLIRLPRAACLIASTQAACARWSAACLRGILQVRLIVARRGSGRRTTAPGSGAAEALIPLSPTSLQECR